MKGWKAPYLKDRLPQEKIDKIIQMGRDNVPYDKIAKELSVSTYTAFKYISIHVPERQRKIPLDYTKTRTYPKEKVKVKIKKPKKRIRKYRKQKVNKAIVNAYVEYDFLQYSFFAFNYISKYYNIPVNKLHVLVYLYPKMFFSYSEFKDVMRPFSRSPAHMIKAMTKDGYFTVFRKADRKKKLERLYQLSDYTKRICGKLHRMCIGDEPIPKIQNKTTVEQPNNYEGFINRMIDRINKENKEIAESEGD